MELDGFASEAVVEEIFDKTNHLIWPGSKNSKKTGTKVAIPRPTVIKRIQNCKQKSCHRVINCKK